MDSYIGCTGVGGKEGHNGRHMSESVPVQLEHQQVTNAEAQNRRGWKETPCPPERYMVSAWTAFIACVSTACMSDTCAASTDIVLNLKDNLI